MNRGREKIKVALCSVLVGLLLASIKLAAGIATGSLGIISEALHSLLDLGAAILTFLAVRVSEKPADETHQYGHWKAENLSALAQALLLVATCIWIVHEAVLRLTGKEALVQASFLAFSAMGASVALDIFISLLLRRAARKYSSQALEADALHYSSDVLSSLVVIAGLAGVKLGVPALDPVAGLGVAILVAVSSTKLGFRAVQQLLDRAPKGASEKIARLLMEVPGIKSVEKVRIRGSGPSTFVDLTVRAARLISLERSHELADVLEGKIKEIMPGSDVVIHFHPSSDGESLSQTARAVVQQFFPGTSDIHDIRIYHDEDSGGHFLGMHIRLDPSLNLEKAHSIMDALERELRKKLPEVEMVETHIEDDECIEDGKRYRAPAEKFLALKKAIMHDGRLKGVHDVFVHNISSGTMVSCHVTTGGDMPLHEAHAVATAVEEKIKKIFSGVVEVIVHTEPAGKDPVS